MSREKFIKSIRAKKKRLSKIAESESDSTFFSFFNESIQSGERQNRLRDGAKIDREKLYGLEFEKQKSSKDYENPSKSLSTRYVPGTSRQALFIGPGIAQDPLTNKIYNYNDSFEEKGVTYPGGSVALQTELMRLSSKLKDLGKLEKKSQIDRMIKALSKID